MGTLQALEAIKLLSGIETERNTLRLFDARSSGWRHLVLNRASTARYAEAAMRILFNDEPMTCDDDLTVAALLDTLRQLKPGTALALNQQILPRERWEHQQVNEGDQILLFQVIAGG